MAGHASSPWKRSSALLTAMRIWQKNMAAQCLDETRKAELLTMAENCRVVPEFAPKTFLQANQLVWFNHLSQVLEVAGGDHTLGRYDQYMYPFYEKEAAKGASEEYFKDIILEFKLKICELWNIRTEKESIADPGCPLWMHIMLGGVLPNGKDGCNELTRVFLRSMKDLQTDEPLHFFPLASEYRRGDLPAGHRRSERRRQPPGLLQRHHGNHLPSGLRLHLEGSA